LVLYLILAFAAGCLFTGLYFSRQGSGRIRELDTRYAGEFPSEAAQLKLWEDLQRNLNESETLLRTYESIIQERENLLRDLQTRLSEMSEIYRTQLI
jgi:hypothetical protein